MADPRRPEPVLVREVANAHFSVNYDLEGSPQGQPPYPSSHKRPTNIILQYVTVHMPSLLSQIKGARDYPNHPLLPKSMRPRVLSLGEARDTQKEAGRTKKSVKGSGGIKTFPIYLETGHAKRTREIIEHIQPILPPDGGQSGNILLCWGKETCGEIIPVKVRLEADDMETWSAINQAWYEHRGSWRRYIPMFGVRAVEQVKVASPNNLPVICSICAHMEF